MRSLKVATALCCVLGSAQVRTPEDALMQSEMSDLDRILYRLNDMQQRYQGDEAVRQKIEQQTAKFANGSKDSARVAASSANLVALNQNLEVAKAGIESPAVAGEVTKFAQETEVQVRGGIDAEKHVKSLLNVGDRLKNANKESLNLVVRTGRVVEGAASIATLRQ